MCLLALYLGQFDDYPLVVAANRDEAFARPSAPPQVLRENPLAYGGKDLRAGGTWLAANEDGLMVGVLNRRSHTERHQPYRSRGLLCLDLLGARNSAQARDELMRQQDFLYRPFNLVFADSSAAYVAYNVGPRITYSSLARGLHVFGNGAIGDSRSEKLRHAFVLFEQAARALGPEPPSARGIQALKDSLSDHTGAHAKRPKDAICVHTPSFGTVSSSLLFYSRSSRCFFTFYAAGAPCQNPYEEGLSVPR
jgi:uncharacterized protein with NRDE domain